ncbi:vWA domain-containing protein [Oceanicoccus sagamiensis]|uniref:VWA domain-containing protein n=1 Tax=Oceanicoccus sagamiensis TaxID=716816 RepID=A0A1X9NCK2_9GAMM|nr:VWA domain-containing protein [Oceanicoccus sagamiensis]ARN75760.1 VWA domain-containing protein [Oceanicoccus sagamiensis]
MFSWESLQYFHFIRPWWLLGITPFLFLQLLQLQRRDVLAQWGKVIADHLLPNMIVERDENTLGGPIGAMGLVTVLLFIALAGPSWDKQPSPFTEDNAALIIAIDLSESMNQKDVQPSRLQRAKQKISDLLALRGDSYTGLIAFAGTAHTIIPLSNDRQVIHHFLDSMSTNMMPRPGKSPQSVLAVTDSLLKEVEVPVTLLVIGDGVTDAAIAAYQQYFDQSPHQLLVWGIGLTQQQLNEQAVEGFSSSTIALQDAMLQRLAADAGGEYQGMTIDKADVERIYRLVDNYFLLAEDDNRPWVDAGYYLVFPIMLIFVLWFRKGWTLQW